MFEGQEIKEGTPSRRDFLLGIVVTSAVALPMFSPPTRAAVSMLHTGLDPNLVESPSEIIPVGKRGGGGGHGRGHGGRGHRSRSWPPWAWR